MYSDKLIEQVIQALKSDEYLSSQYILRAYPNISKPTRLDRVAIALSPDEIDIKNISIGETCYFGNYKILATIFVPVELGTPIIESTVAKIVNSCAYLNATAISSSGITYNSTSDCYKVECVITFSDTISTGGEDDE